MITRYHLKIHNNTTLQDRFDVTVLAPGRTARLYIPFVIPAIFRAPGPASVRKLLEKAVFVDPRFADEGWVATTVEEWKSKARRKDYVATGSALRRPDASVAADLPRLRIPTFRLTMSGRRKRAASIAARSGRNLCTSRTPSVAAGSRNASKGNLNPLNRN